MGHNLTKTAVSATMTTWNLEMKSGASSGAGAAPNASAAVRTLHVDRGGGIEVAFPPGVTTTFELKQLEAAPPSWTRPDLAIGADDVVLTNEGVRVTVHNIGGAEAPVSEIALIDADGRVRATVPLAALAAPHDLLPKTRTISLPLSGPRSGQSVVLDPGERMEEISETNNRVEL